MCCARVGVPLCVARVRPVRAFFWTDPVPGTWPLPRRPVHSWYSRTRKYQRTTDSDTSHIKSSLKSDAEARHTYVMPRPTASAAGTLPRASQPRLAAPPPDPPPLHPTRAPPQMGINPDTSVLVVNGRHHHVDADDRQVPWACPDSTSPLLSQHDRRRQTAAHGHAKMATRTAATKPIVGPARPRGAAARGPHRVRHGSTSRGHHRKGAAHTRGAQVRVSAGYATGATRQGAPHHPRPSAGIRAAVKHKLASPPTTLPTHAATYQ